jgi:hypothetical protein
VSTPTMRGTQLQEAEIYTYVCTRFYIYINVLLVLIHSVYRQVVKEKIEKTWANIKGKSAQTYKNAS